MFTGNTFFILVVLVVVVAVQMMVAVVFIVVQYFHLSRLRPCFQPGPAGPGVQGGAGLPEAQRRGGDEQLGGEEERSLLLSPCQTWNR